MCAQRTYLSYSEESKQLKFDIDKYKTAQQTIGQHIVAGAKECEARRVVLSAYGVGAFLGILRKHDQECQTEFETQAMKEAAAAFAKTIIALREDGRVVVFSDISKDIKTGGAKKEYGSQKFWDLVNEELTSQKQTPLEPVNEEKSAIGDGWIKDTDMIVNAWDPDSLVGNGLEKDNTFDGQIGRRSLLHFLHALACNIFNQSKQNQSKQN